MRDKARLLVGGERGGEGRVGAQQRTADQVVHRLGQRHLLAEPVDGALPARGRIDHESLPSPLE
jgi:hypothetical protein